MAGGLLSVPNLSDPGTDMQLAGQGLLEAGTLTANPFLFLTGAVVEALSVIPQLISAFSGVPKNQKTVETGQRLLQSINPAVQLLGTWWYKAGQLGIVDSSAPDIATYFKPAFDYTIQTLGIPYASPAWYALSQVIGEGAPASVFDTAYKTANLPVPMFVPSSAFSIQNPQDRYPQELVQLYTGYIPNFVNAPAPTPTPQSGNGTQSPGVPITPAQPGADDATVTQCCQSIVNGLNLVATAVGDLSLEQGLATIPQIVAVLQQIATQGGVIVNAVNGLVSIAGQGAGSFAQTMENVANLLGSVVINTAGEETTALNALTTAIVNALGKIDVDSENSLAGIARAVSSIDLSTIVKAITDCCTTNAGVFAKNMPLWETIVNAGSVDAQAGSLADPWPFDQIITALTSLAKYLGGEAGAVESGLGKLLVNVVEPWIKNAFGLAESEARTFLATVESLIQQYAPTVINFFSNVINVAAPLVETIPGETLNALLYFVKAQGPITPETSEATGLKVLGLGWIIGQIVHLAMELAGRLFYPVSSVFAHNAQITVGALGYEEILRNIHRSFFPNAFGRSQNYFYQAQFRPLLPDIGRSLEFYARRLISEDNLNSLLAYNGINATWAPAMVQASYRPIQPRALAAVLGEYNFDQSKVVELLKYGGMRDQDVTLMVDALVQRGLQPLRQALINQTVTMAGEGLMSDSDVASALTQENLTDDAKNLINQRIALLRLHTMATLTKTELVAAAKNKLITVDQLGADLSATGYQDAEVQIIQNTVSQYLTAKEAAAEARQVSAEEQRLQQLTIRQAQQSFKRGDIDLGTFAAELTAAGVPVDRIAAYTSLASVLNEPTLRPGAKLSATAQKQQSAKLAIKSLSEEFKKGVIDEGTLRSGLAANAMSPADVDATVNYLVALGTKAAAAAAATVPLAS